MNQFLNLLSSSTDEGANEFLSEEISRNELTQSLTALGKYCFDILD